MKLDDFKNVTESFGLKTSDDDMVDLSGLDKIRLNDVEAGQVVKGKPIATYFEPREEDGDKKYTSVRLQIVDSEARLYLEAYCNVPLQYPVIKKLHKNNNFYRTTFDWINTTVSKLDNSAMLDADGNVVTCIEEFNLKNFIKFVNGLNEVEVKVMEIGDTGYNTFIVQEIK